jgi:hypothetical protein
MNYRKIYEEYYGVKLNPKIVIHHIDHYHYNNDPKNLVAIQPSLHTKYHIYWNRLNEYDPQRMVSYKQEFIKLLNNFEKAYQEIINICNERN